MIEKLASFLLCLQQQHTTRVFAASPYQLPVCIARRMEGLGQKVGSSHKKATEAGAGPFREPSVKATAAEQIHCQGNYRWGQHRWHRDTAVKTTEKFGIDNEFMLSLRKTATRGLQHRCIHANRAMAAAHMQNHYPNNPQRP